MGRRLENKVAIITGAAAGIGAETARLFASEGAAVVVADIRGGLAEEVVARIQAAGGKALAIETDISHAGQVDRLFLETEAAFGGLDVLVNNAFSSAGDGTLEELEEAVWDRIIEVTLKGPFLCSRQAIPMMKARGGGSIVTLSSINALFGVGETAYTAAKGGLIAMMRLVAAEYGRFHIRSNVICPGTIDTEFCMAYWKQYPAGFAALKEMYPMGRIGTPREVANYILFLASDESSFVTGSVQVVDGGFMAGRKFEMR